MACTIRRGEKTLEEMCDKCENAQGVCSVPAMAVDFYVSVCYRRKQNWCDRQVLFTLSPLTLDPSLIGKSRHLLV